MAYEEQIIGLNRYKAVEYKDREGNVSYVLLYIGVSVVPTDTPEEGTCWRQIASGFRTIREAFLYASLLEEFGELSNSIHQKTRRLEHVKGILKGWDWVA